MKLTTAYLLSCLSFVYFGDCLDFAYSDRWLETRKHDIHTAAKVVHFKNGPTDSKVFHFYNNEKNGYDANEAFKYCLDMGGQMGTILDNETADFIYKQLQSFSNNSPTSGDPWIESFWLGVVDISLIDNVNKWMWLTMQPLEGQMSNPLWYHHRMKRDLMDEHNSTLMNRCAIIGSQNRPDGGAKDVRGLIRPVSCYNRSNILCQNIDASSYIYPRSDWIWKRIVNISCVAFGENFTSTWLLNGKRVSEDRMDHVYQYKGLRIPGTHESKLIIDGNHHPGGFYFDCEIKNSTFAYNLTFKVLPNITLHSNTVTHTYTSHDDVTCTAVGIPPPTIEWAINGAWMKPKLDLYRIETRSSGFQTTSSFKLIRPFSFGSNVTLYCAAMNGASEVKQIKLNSDFKIINDWSVAMPYTGGKESCKAIGGFLMLDNRGDWCMFKAIEVHERKGKCKGADISFDFIDRTKSAQTFHAKAHHNYTISYGELDYIQPVTRVNMTRLNPRTSYTITVSYRPPYWKRAVKAKYSFKTRGKPPGVIRDITTTVTLLGNCRVKYTTPGQLSQISQIKLASLDDKNHAVIPFHGSMFVFNHKGRGQQFTATLVTCGGEEGAKSEAFECTESSLIGWYIAGAIIAISLLIVGKFTCTAQARKKSKERIVKLRDRLRKKKEKKTTSAEKQMLTSPGVSPSTDFYSEQEKTTVV